MKVYELIERLNKLPGDYYVQDEVTAEEINEIFVDEENKIISLDHD